MSCRIRKLILDEYSNFKDIVLIESPFAEISEDGVGLRQTQIALTPTKLLIAKDVFNKEVTTSLTNVFPEQISRDPEIDTLELASLFPLDYASMKVYEEDERFIMSITLSNNKVLYFEFGGHVLRDSYWNTWKKVIEDVKNLEKLTKEKEKTESSVSNSSQDIPQFLLVSADVHSCKAKNSEKSVTMNTATSKNNLKENDTKLKCRKKFSKWRFPFKRISENEINSIYIENENNFNSLGK